MPDPFSKTPFRDGQRFTFEPPSPVASVAVECEGTPAPRAFLARAGRAAGLACDAMGGVSAARVKIRGVAADAPLSRRSGSRVLFIVGRGMIERSGPADLRKVFENALREAAEADAADFAAAAGPAPGGAGAEHPGGDRSSQQQLKVLVFENLFTDPDFPGEMEHYFACGPMQLASSLASEGHRVIVLNGRLSRKDVFTRMDLLRKVLLGERPDLACVTLLEACAEETAALVNAIKETGGTVVAAGGPMATITPEHAAVHLEGADFIVRGDGDEAVCRVARLCVGLKAQGGFDPSLEEDILSCDGMLFFGPNRLLMGHPGRVNAVRDLDASPFDASFLHREHVAGGISLETSRGCAHPCTFCVAPARGRPRGRSPGGIGLRLKAYEERLRRLWPDGPPSSARRIQFPDDDFACDPGRAAGILKAIAGSGFFLSSFQASVRDFFARRSGEWTIDERLAGVLSPGLFQDAPLLELALKEEPRGRRESRFNSFVKLGVESFCNEELGRLGKGYRLEHVETVIGMLDAGRIVHDAYFIFSNRRTRINDVVTSFISIARLKIQHPYTFYIRFPVVPHLVTTFPSPGFRIWLKEKERCGEGGETGKLEIDRWLRAPGYPEYDYPVVKRDLPSDPVVLEAAGRLQELFEPDGMYLKPLENLRGLVKGMIPSLEEKEGPMSRAASDARIAARRLAGAGKLIIYDGIRRARERKIPKEIGERFHAAAGMLGDPAGIVPELRRIIEAGDPRLVLIPTRDCSLRCRYCPMIKEEGKLMSAETAVKGIEMILSSERPSVILQFFGGEALLRRRFVLDVMAEAVVMARRLGKKLGFIVSTNGVSLDEPLIDLLRSMPVKIEVSIDGTREVHLKHRIGKDPSTNSYDRIARITPALLQSGIPNDAIMVVNPNTVGKLSESFSHVVDLGYRRVQVNPALGVRWSDEEKRELALQLHEIEKKFFTRTVRPDGLEFVDLWSFRTPMLLNGEITVDYDGTIYFGNGFLVRTSTPGAFTAGRLEDLEGFDACYVRRLDNDYLLEHTYPKPVTRNNLQVGRILGSFVRHIRERFPEEFARPRATRAPESPGHAW